MKEIAVVLIGLSSYGTGYARDLVENGKKHGARLVGVVDPYAEKNEYWSDLKALGMPRFDTLPEFLAEHRADLAAIASPIHLHCPQTCAALEAGMHVLCEKPAVGAIQDLHRMIAARNKAKRFVAIGYNWSFADETQSLKRDIMAGLYGRPRRVKTIVLWPRDLEYYRRNNWAGKLHSAAGDWILDSPINNATAHYLHNMFYVLGPTVSTSAMPGAVTAELYRANAIENYDTACLRASTTDGVELFYAASHATPEYKPVRFEFEFEKACLRCEEEKEIVVQWKDGHTDIRGVPSAMQQFAKLGQCIEAARGGPAPVCGLEAAMAQTICMNGAQESPARIETFPAVMVRTQDCPPYPRGVAGKAVSVEGLVAILERSFAESKLPSELGIPWAKPSRRVELTDYTFFPGGRPNP